MTEFLHGCLKAVNQSPLKKSPVRSSLRSEEAERILPRLRLFLLPQLLFLHWVISSLLTLEVGAKARGGAGQEIAGDQMMRSLWWGRRQPPRCPAPTRPTVPGSSASGLILTLIVAAENRPRGNVERVGALPSEIFTPFGSMIPEKR